MFTFVQSICHHNVVSHASNLVTHLPVLLSLLNIDILSSQMSASITPQPGVGGQRRVSFHRNRDVFDKDLPSFRAINSFLIFNGLTNGFFF